MKERLIIIVLAIISGLVITTVAFFIYQNFISTTNTAQDRTIPDEKISPQPTENLLLEIAEPADGSLTDKRTISVKGATNPENIVIVSSNQEDNSGKATSDGNFSITIDIDAGANYLIVRSIAPDGSAIKKEIVVTYTTEEF